MTTYYERFSGSGPSRTPIALYRREVDDDISTDGVYSKDGTWPFTSALAIWMLNLGDSEIEQVSEAEAERFIAEVTARNLA